MTPELKNQICTLKSQTEIAVAQEQPQTVSLWLVGKCLRIALFHCVECLIGALRPMKCVKISIQTPPTVCRNRKTDHANTFPFNKIPDSTPAL